MFPMIAEHMFLSRVKTGGVAEFTWARKFFEL
jgi:hypothetical protein